MLRGTLAGWTPDGAHVVEEKYFVPLPGIKIRFPGSLARVLVTVWAG